MTPTEQDIVLEECALCNYSTQFQKPMIITPLFLKVIFLGTLVVLPEKVLGGIQMDGSFNYHWSVWSYMVRKYSF